MNIKQGLENAGLPLARIFSIFMWNMGHEAPNRFRLRAVGSILFEFLSLLQLRNFGVCRYRSGMVSEPRLGPFSCSLHNVCVLEAIIDICKLN
jgi:hypothetical protein